MNRPEHSRTDPVALTASGEARREEMLAALQLQVRARGRRRRVRNGSLAVTSAAALIAIVVIAGQVFSPAPSRVPSAPIADSTAPNVAPKSALSPNAIVASSNATAKVTFVRSTVTSLDRYTSRARTSIQLGIISDDELLETLAEQGRPAGLIRIEGRTWLTSEIQAATREDAERGETQGHLDPRESDVLGV